MVAAAMIAMTMKAIPTTREFFLLDPPIAKDIRPSHTNRRRRHQTRVRGKLSIPAAPAKRSHCYVAWRRFADTFHRGGIAIAKSIDGGVTFSSPVDVVTFPLSCLATPTGADADRSRAQHRGRLIPHQYISHYGRG